MWVWILGVAILWWAPGAFTFREQPGRREAHWVSPKGPWILLPTQRYRVLWSARTSILAIATLGGLFLGWLAPFEDGSANPVDMLWTGIFAAFLADAAAHTARAYLGRVELHTWGVLVRRPLGPLRIQWSEIRLVKRFYALDGFAILRHGKPPVLLSMDMHGLGRFVRELLARAPEAAQASNLRRFPVPIRDGRQIHEQAG